MDLGGIAKVIKTIVILTLLTLFLGSILDIKIEEWVKISIPKPSIKIEEPETDNVKTVYLIDDQEVTTKEYFKWVADKDKAEKWGKGKMISKNLRVNSKTGTEKKQKGLRK